MEGLRDFLRRELGDTACDVPLKILISKCYRELLQRANNGQKGKIPARLLQEKLRQIAGELLKKRQ